MASLEQDCVDLLEKCIRYNPQEINELDWKQDLSSKPERLTKHLSAFANYPGSGFLVFGVEDSGSLIGLEENRSKEIADTLANLARTALEPEISIQCFSFNYKGYSLLGVQITESKDKPVHIKGSSFDKAYIRAGGQSRKMSKQEMKRAIITSTPSRFEELEVYMEEASPTDWLDKFDFSEFSKKTRPSGYSSEQEMLEHLFNYKLVTRVNGKYQPTNLCVITCAKSFDDFPGFEKFGLRFLHYPSESRLTAQKDLILNKGYTLALDNIVSNIMSALPHNEVIEAATRTNFPAIPLIAVRELVVNAIIHRDLTRNDSYIMLELFKDRLEITNPGGLLAELSIDRLIDHPSQSRNEVLADIMRKLNFSEKRGSGIDKAIEAIEIFGLPPILFQSTPSYFKVNVYLHKDFSSMSKAERIEAVYQHSCLNYVFQKQTNNASLRQRFKFEDKDSTKVYRLIKGVLDAKKIKVKDNSASKKDISYMPYWA